MSTEDKFNSFIAYIGSQGQKIADLDHYFEKIGLVQDIRTTEVLAWTSLNKMDNSLISTYFLNLSPDYQV